MCDCLAKINEALREDTKAEDAQIDMIINFTSGVAYPRMAATYTPPGRKRKVETTIQPTFCPFCGTKYEEDT